MKPDWRARSAALCATHEPDSFKNMSYTKLSSSILTSTIWMEGPNIKLVWITLLVLADKNGEVTATIPGLAWTAGVPLQDCEAAINKFLAPDPYSRTPDDEGRRLERIEGGWSLLNHQKYRLMAGKDEQKSSNAQRQQRWRDRQERNGKGAPRNGPVTPSVGAVTQGRDIAEAEAEAENSLPTLSVPPCVDPPVAGGERKTFEVDFTPDGVPALVDRIMATYPTRAGQPRTARELLVTKTPEQLRPILSAVQDYAAAAKAHPDGKRFVQSVHNYFINEQYLVPAGELLRPPAAKQAAAPKPKSKYL